MSIHHTARIIANHQRTTQTGDCICGEWPPDDHLEPWTLHVAKAIHAAPKSTARPPHPATMIGRTNRAVCLLDADCIAGVDHDGECIR